MDYAVQLLVIVVLFTFAGLWIQDHWWPSPLAPVLMSITGIVCGLMVLYKRSVEESKRAERLAASKRDPNGNDHKAENDYDKRD